MNHQRRLALCSTQLVWAVVLIAAWAPASARDGEKAGVTKTSNPASAVAAFGPSLAPEGTPDDPPVFCDAGLALDSAAPLDAAKAMDVCRVASDESDWGLVSAQWVMPDGTPATHTPAYAIGHGLLYHLGLVTPWNGARLLALSSGTARAPDDPGYSSPEGYDKGISGGVPLGFPMASVSCGQACEDSGPIAYDPAALELELRAPPNAYGFSFQFMFFTAEYPEYWCQEFNDHFLALLDPAPPGTYYGNIAFDALGNPVSANSAFLEVCAPDYHAPCYTCLLGTGQLDGTGFEGHGGTGWRSVTAPVEPNSLIRLRFAIYDSGDHLFDSTALVDGFEWLVQPYRIWLPLVQEAPAG